MKGHRRHGHRYVLGARGDLRGQHAAPLALLDRVPLQDVVHGRQRLPGRNQDCGGGAPDPWYASTGTDATSQIGCHSHGSGRKTRREAATPSVPGRSASVTRNGSTPSAGRIRKERRRDRIAEVRLPPLRPGRRRLRLRQALAVQTVQAERGGGSPSQLPPTYGSLLQNARRAHLVARTFYDSVAVTPGVLDQREHGWDKSPHNCPGGEANCTCGVDGVPKRHLAPAVTMTPAKRAAK